MRERRLEEKALLLLDNCRAHSPANTLRSDDGKFCVMFMPPNTTSIIQPLDQGIISSFKRHYRTDLVKDIVLSDMDVRNVKSMGQGDSNDDPQLLDGRTRACIPNTFAGFTDEEIREAEDKLQDHLEDDQTLASFVDRWADIDNTCAVDEPLTSDQIAADANQ